MEHSSAESAVLDSPASVGHLLRELVRDLGMLFRQEFDLARSEMVEKVDAAKGGALKMGIALGAGLAATIFIAAALMLGMTLLLTIWLPPLGAAFAATVIVGAGLGIAAFVLFRSGIEDVKARKFVPERTLESLKENAQWASKQLQ